MPEVRLLPAREFPLDDAGRTRFRSRYREAFEGDPSKSPLYKDVSNGVAPGGIEYYLPLFFEATATLADYLPPTTSVLALHGDVRTGDRALLAGHAIRVTGCCAATRRGRCCRRPSIFLPADAFFGMLKPFARIELAAAAAADDPAGRPTRRRRCPPCRSSAAPTIRSPR